MIKVNSVREDIQDTQLEEPICKALSLTGMVALLGDLEAPHKMRQKDRAIVNFSSRKKNV